MTSIGKHDHVQCVLGHNKKGVTLVEGKLYVVDEVEPFDGMSCGLHGDSDCFGVRTKSPILPSGLYWCSKRFIPILRYKEHQFDYMLEIDDIKTSEPLKEEA